MCRVFCQFLMFMPSVVFNLTWAFNPLSTKLPFNACSTTLCLHKVRTENEFTTRYVHVWRGEEVQRTRIFFLMMLLELYKRKELLSGCTWQFFAVARGCCWFRISVEAFSESSFRLQQFIQQLHQKFVVCAHKANLEENMMEGNTIERNLHGQ